MVEDRPVLKISQNPRMLPNAPESLKLETKLHLEQHKAAELEETLLKTQADLSSRDKEIARLKQELEVLNEQYTKDRSELQGLLEQEKENLQATLATMDQPDENGLYASAEELLHLKSRPVTATEKSEAHQT